MFGEFTCGILWCCASHGSTVWGGFCFLIGSVFSLMEGLTLFRAWQLRLGQLQGGKREGKFILSTTNSDRSMRPFMSKASVVWTTAVGFLIKSLWGAQQLLEDAGLNHRVLVGLGTSMKSEAPWRIASVGVLGRQVTGSRGSVCLPGTGYPHLSYLFPGISRCPHYASLPVVMA